MENFFDTLDSVLFITFGIVMGGLPILVAILHSIN